MAAISVKNIHYECPAPWFRNFNLIPCKGNPICLVTTPNHNSTGAKSWLKDGHMLFLKVLTCPTGSDWLMAKNSRHENLPHIQPSRFVLWLIATTTKISTEGCFTASQEGAYVQPTRCLSLLERDYDIKITPFRCLQKSCLSAINFQG